MKKNIVLYFSYGIKKNIWATGINWGENENCPILDSLSARETFGRSSLILKMNVSLKFDRRIIKINIHFGISFRHFIFNHKSLVLKSIYSCFVYRPSHVRFKRQFTDIKKRLDRATYCFPNMIFEERDFQLAPYWSYPRAYCKQCRVRNVDRNVALLVALNEKKLTQGVKVKAAVTKNLLQKGNCQEPSIRRCSPFFLL